MNPVHPTPTEVAYWAARDGQESRQVVIGGPEEGDDVVPCPALVGDGLVRVAWELNEVELARLATGGRLWLVIWGGLPIHCLEVVARENTTYREGNA